MYVILKRVTYNIENKYKENDSGIYYERVGEAKTKEAIQIMYGDLIMYGTSANDLGIVKDCSVMVGIDVVLEEEEE